MKLLVFDVSGNFQEGKGTTGICYVEDDDIQGISEIKATESESTEAYWARHTDVIKTSNPDAVIVEGFRLYGSKAREQVSSQFETPQLIGYMRMYCWLTNTPLHIQYAAEVKSRWSDDVLKRLGVLDEKLRWNGQRTNAHKRDAIRHALHFMRYKNK